MTATMKNARIESPGGSGFSDLEASDEQRRTVTSIPLRTALQIAKERQRSKSSRRKIFREEPERYLDIVNLMRSVGREEG